MSPGRVRVGFEELKEMKSQIFFVSFPRPVGIDFVFTGRLMILSAIVLIAASLALGKALPSEMSGLGINSFNRVSLPVSPCINLSFSKSSFKAGDRPAKVITSDFNRDGVRDLAVTEFTSKSTNIFIGKGDGTFTKTSTISTGKSVAILAADFDRDGKPDIAAADIDAGMLRIFKGAGGGVFSPGFTKKISGTPAWISSADFNSDGIVDLSVSHAGPGIVTVLLGKGDGTFRLISTPKTDTNPSSMGTADFNRDGIVDIVTTARGKARINVLIGNGDGTFQAKKDFPIGSDPDNLVVADFNRDGNPDVAAAVAPKNVGVLIGDGRGGFKAVRSYTVGGNPHALTSGDMNGDGIVDLVAGNLGNASETFSVLLGKSDGSFATHKEFGKPFRGEFLVADDLNLDGRIDLAGVTTIGNRGVRVFLNQCTRTCTRPDFEEPTGSPYSAGTRPLVETIADINNDGLPDLAIGNSANSVSFSVGIGNGRFNPGAVPSVTVGFSPRFIKAVRFNHDRKVDFIVQSGNRVAVLFGDGRGGFRVKQSTIILSLFTFGSDDFNLDGIPDLVSSDGRRGRGSRGFNGNLRIYLGNANGSFKPPLRIRMIKEPIVVTTGDFNSDGIPDIASSSRQTWISVLLGRGDGSFTKTRVTTRAGIRFLKTGDFNSDGNTDLLAGFGRSLGIYLGNGSGGFSEQPRTRTSALFNAMAALDFNSNNALDVITANSAGNSVNLFVGNGTGRLTEIRRKVRVGTKPVSISVGDLNRDGEPDFVTSNYGSNNNSVLINSCGIPTNTPPKLTILPVDRTVGFPASISGIATVLDTEDPEENLIVKVNGGSSATVNGVSVSRLTVDRSGNITALVGAQMSATAASFQLMITDIGGLSAIKQLNVTVKPNPAPKVSLVAPPVGSVFRAGENLEYTASFLDNAGDKHTAEWALRGFFETQTHSGTIDENAGIARLRLSFRDAGIFRTKLEVMDSAGQAGVSDRIGSQEAYVVIVDPAAGSVKARRCWGSAKFDSPAGAFKADPTLAGNAKIKFDIRYRNAGGPPSGKLKFQFDSGNLKFRSSSYKWLVISKNRSQLAGDGTINGSGKFRFIVTAIDGNMNGASGADKLRMQIWDDSTDKLVYDNQVSGDIGILAEPNTVIRKGKVSIKDRK